MSVIRRFIANNWPVRIWFAAVLAVWLKILMQTCRPTGHLLADWQALVIFLLLAITSLVAAVLTGGILASLLLGPFYQFQATRNGAPFEPGDHVRILSGKHRGRVTRVYSKWQGGTFRVELDEAAKGSYKDIYGGYELLRLPSSSV